MPLYTAIVVLGVDEPIERFTNGLLKRAEAPEGHHP